MPNRAKAPKVTRLGKPKIGVDFEDSILPRGNKMMTKAQFNEACKEMADGIHKAIEEKLSKFLKKDSC